MDANFSELSELVNLLNSIFDKEPKHLWKCYYKKFIKQSKWCIASDYCLDSKNKANNCFAYTIFPYIDFNFLQSKIEEVLPKDIKNIKNIDKNTVELLKSPFFFSIIFIINEKDFFYKSKINNKKTKILYLFK